MWRDPLEGVFQDFIRILNKPLCIFGFYMASFT